MRISVLLVLMILPVVIFAHEWHEGPKVTNNDLLSVSAPDDSVAWVCGRNGTVLLTLTGGRTWIDRSGNTTFAGLDLVHIFGVNANLAFIIANPLSGNSIHKTSSILFRTSDRGLNWQTVLTLDGGHGNAVFMYDENSGIYFGNPINGKWSIFLTKNGGLTWDSTGVNILSPETGESGYTNGMFGDMLFSHSLMFGTNKDRFYASYDFGKTWIVRTVPGLTEIHAIAFADSANGIVAGTGLFKTTDGGQTWKDNSSLVLGNGLITAIISHDFWHYFLIRAGGGNDLGNRVYHSGNFTDSNWDTAYTAWDLKPFLYLGSARYGGYAYGLRQGGGISIAVHDDPPVTEVQKNGNNPVEYSLSQNYPNPFNPETKINYSVPENSFVTIKVYDILGNLKATLVNANKPAGNYFVNFNAAGLSSGLYIYEIRGNHGFSLSRKMLILK